MPLLRGGGRGGGGGGRGGGEGVGRRGKGELMRGGHPPPPLDQLWVRLVDKITCSVGEVINCVGGVLIRPLIIVVHKYSQRSAHQVLTK